MIDLKKYVEAGGTNGDEIIFEYNGEFKWLSNFDIFQNEEDYIVDVFGIKYPSVEHAYQANKFNSPDLREIISNHPSIGLKKTVRAMLEANPLHTNKLFHRDKAYIMSDLLAHKFVIPHYKNLLLSTGDKPLIEGNRWNDKFWGVCLKTFKGRNLLAEMHMNIRKDLQNNEGLW